MRKVLKRLAVPLIAATALAGAVVTSASASGSWSCPGPWHVWQGCATTSTALAQAKVQAFSSIGLPYYVLSQMSGHTDRQFGPINDLNVHTLPLQTVGTVRIAFYNNHATSSSGLYALTVN